MRRRVLGWGMSLGLALSADGCAGWAGPEHERAAADYQRQGNEAARRGDSKAAEAARKRAEIERRLSEDHRKVDPRFDENEQQLPPGVPYSGTLRSP
ncbi:MAG TPA: hypothetical protein VH877_09190 [Polyangia bacterium]|nr:hypothetical protein [Polyangia bacterium]